MKNLRRNNLMNLLSKLAVCMLALIMTLSISGCGTNLKNYTPATRFLYSKDGGSSWSETIQEVPVRQTYYLAIEMAVSRSTGLLVSKEVVVEIKIPGTDILDCYLDDHPGTTITGETDPLDNSVTYTFTLLANTNPDTYRVIFECMPLDVGRTTIQVTYDDKIPEEYDETSTIKYIDDQNSGESGVEEN